MTAKEFADKMREIEQANECDWEVIHSKGDDVMCALLRELGFNEGVDIYEAWTRYHA